MASFTYWSGKLREFSFGANLKIARRKLDRLKGENAIVNDFDLEKIKSEEGMTVAKWGGVRQRANNCEGS